MSDRRPLLGGNWKMHKTAAEAEEFCKKLVETGEPRAEVVLFPSHPLLPIVARGLGDGWVAVGGQDVHSATQGAFTGDVSAAQLVDAGCTWVLCGHSERRRDHGETDDQVADKAIAAERAGLKPLICLGESLDQRRAGETEAVLTRQLEGALAHRPQRFAIAYEPVWAIGTGETASPEQAQSAHQHLRTVLADLYDQPTADARRIIYGGSANPETAPELIATPDIDGFLVGGASLEPESFLAMIARCS